MKNLNGWQIVALVGLVLGAIVALVAMGQEIAAVSAVGIMVASALGVPIYQQAVNGEKVGQVKELANGNLKRLQDQIADIYVQHAAERADWALQLQAANDKATALAAMLPPDTKIPD